MIEVTVLNYLNNNSSVDWFMEEPSNEDAFGVLERTGGGRVNHVNTCQFAVQSYDTSLYKASVLNEETKGIMFNLSSIKGIGKVTLVSDYNFTDQTKKRYRYQAVFEIVYTEE